MSRSLPSQSTDFPGWYNAVVRRAELAEHSSVRGAMVIRPYGFAIWEAIQRALDDRIKATGHENISLPLLMPVSLLEREADLVEGFAPEIALVTEAGGEPLAEPLAIRPTSEAAVWDAYGRWIRSYRDLPLLYNQWSNVVRWELRPRLFLRTTEFLWQEGHTAHETADQAVREALLILHEVYLEVTERVLALPVVAGRKSPGERFPGAVETFTVEAMMRDGRALQSATSHYLGDGFARAFGATFTGRDGADHHPFGTSWGASTRLVGGAVMAHGDDRGLRLPPAVAPDQVVIVPIGGEEGAVAEAAAGLADELRAAGLRVRLDGRDHVRPGAKFHEWELRGVPVRAELGERDLAASAVTLVRRDTGAREQVGRARAAVRCTELMDEIQASLLAEGREMLRDRTRACASLDEVRDAVTGARGFATGVWCGDAACERWVKEETGATIRLLPLDPDPGGRCVVCGRDGADRATWGQAY